MGVNGSAVALDTKRK